MSVWTTIQDAYVAIDGFATSFMIRLFRDNTQFLKDVIDAVSGAPKVPAQVFPIQASGSGAGLVVKQWNNLKYTIPSTAVAASTTVELDTGVTMALTRTGQDAVINVVSGSNYLLSWEIVSKPGAATGRAFLSLSNSGSGSVTVSGSVFFLGVG